MTLISVVGFCSAGPLPPPPEALGTTPTQAAQKLRNTDDKAVQLLRQLEQRYADVHAIAGRFRQTTEDATFGEKIEAQGRFMIKKPERFRADYAPPYASTTIINNGYSYRFVPQLNQVERYRIPTDQPLTKVNYMLLGFGARTEEILRVYRVQLVEAPMDNRTTAFVLVPHHQKNAPFKSIKIVMERDSLTPIEFEVKQLDGGTIRASIDKSSLRLDADIPDSEFEPRFPINAQLVDIL